MNVFTSIDIRVLTLSALLALLSSFAVIPDAHAITLTSPGLYSAAKAGQISSGMWNRGELDKKLKPKCGWSNADADYRVSRLGRLLEHLADAANQGLSDAVILARAEALSKEINKSSMYQTCFKNMVQVDLQKPLTNFQPPEHPYGQKHQVY